MAMAREYDGWSNKEEYLREEMARERQRHYMLQQQAALGGLLGMQGLAAGAAVAGGVGGAAALQYAPNQVEAPAVRKQEPQPNPVLLLTGDDE